MQYRRKNLFTGAGDERNGGREMKKRLLTVLLPITPTGAPTGHTQP